jgi:hypothetical protein
MPGGIVETRWYGDRVKADVRRRAETQIARIGEIAVEHAQRLVGHQGSRGVHSRPGEPPYRQSGELQESIFARPLPGRMQVQVGTSSMVGLYMELGTRRIAPRPWLRRTMKEIQPQIDSLTAGRVV